MTIGDYQKIFRSGRGTTDKVFIRQITEKAYEHNIKSTRVICRPELSL